MKTKFNAAFLVDVGCPLPDKALALEKIFEVLAEGGRLIIADWIEKDDLNLGEREILVEPFNNFWSFPYIRSNYAIPKSSP